MKRVIFILKRVVFLSLAAALALQPAMAEAQGVYNGNPAAFSQFQFAGIGAQTEAALGTRVGPYLGNFLDDTAGAFNIYCVDYLHWADGNPADVNVSQLSGSLGDTRLGKNLSATDALAKYQRSAYLSSLFESWNSVDSDRTTAFAAIHSAIWKTTSGVDLGSAGVMALRDLLLAEDASGVNLDEWYVITDAAATDGYGQGRGTGTYDGRGQEFLVRRASVPEPGAMLLLLTGLVMLVGVNRRRVFDV